MAIKVRVLRSVQAGLASMSGLVALSSGASACTAETAPADGSVTEGESALSVANPGTGTLDLAFDYATPLGYAFAAHNSTDEYVRAGEKMSISVPLHFLWSRLYPDAATPEDLARLEKLSAKVKVVYAHPSLTLGSSNSRRTRRSLARRPTTAPRTPARSRSTRRPPASASSS